jgi:enamine deaminase RidA (YjgF/YER057c/UK114 family)
MTPDEAFLETGLVLPPPPRPAGLYKPMVITVGYVYVSGHGSVRQDGSLLQGKVGGDMDAEAGKQAARQAGLNILSTLMAGLGSLNRIGRVVKVLGMVNSTPDFTRHPYVINGCSELFGHIWGMERGVGARSAVGMASLPDQIAIEIEAVFELA